MAEPLVTPSWLANEIGKAGLIILDLRLPLDGGRASFEAGHIPGSVFSDYAADGWRRKAGNVPGLLPDAAHLSTLFARLGITPSDHVVLVPVGSSANDFAASARAYWTLKIAGHSNVSILNGGTKGWLAAGYILETGTDAPVGVASYPVTFDASLRAEADDILQSGAALVDARSSSYFSGLEKASEAKRAGHIPGALSLDYAHQFDGAHGALKPLSQLEAAFAALPSGPVISYCNTGHTAALNWFVLSALMGRDARLYDGSMTDWTQDDTRPVQSA